MLLGYLTKKSKPTSRVHSKNTSLSLPLQEQAKSPSKKLYKFVANNGLPEAPTDAKWMEIIPSGE